MKGRERALDPETAKRVANLSLTAKKAVDGLLSGVHRSPHRGASVVFVEHREYRPGDDLRLLDWRAFARSDRHQIKRFEQETHLRGTLVLDRSASMTYAGEGRPSKLEHASTLLAALAFILVRQGDAAGLAVVDDEVRERLPPRTRPAHLEAVFQALAAPARDDAGTDLGRTLGEVAERAGRRGLVAIASDLLDFEDGALHALGSLTGRGHDVILFHVLDPDELELPFDTPSRFEGLEHEGTIDADPELLRAAYLEELERFLDSCRDRAVAVGARYVLAPTDHPVEQILASVLTAARRRGWGR